MTQNAEKTYTKKFVRCVLLPILLLSLLIEVFVFNARSFELFGLHTSVLSSPFSTTDCVLDSFDGCEIRISGAKIPNRIYTIAFDFSEIPEQILAGQIDLQEDGYFAGHQKAFKIVPYVAHSRNIFVYPSNQVTEIKLHFDSVPNGLKTITLNLAVPFAFNALRFGMIFALAMMIWVFLPNSEIYRLRLNLRCQKQRIAVLGFVLVQLGILSVAVITNYVSAWDIFHADNHNWFNKDHYELQSDSFLQRSVALLEEPPQGLANLANPYDSAERLRYGITDSVILFDTAYYAQKYYVYFGVVPQILLFLPYRILTNRHLPLDFAVLLAAVLAWLGLFTLFKKWVSYFFPEINFGIFLLGLMTLFIGSGFVWCVTRPMTYELATLSATAFALWGIVLCFSAVSAPGLKLIKFFMGSLCLVLAVGCRPTVALVSLLMLPLFGFLLREFWYKHQKRNTFLLILTVLIPFGLVGICLMAYNYIRFDSIFEFGQNYQLSLEDNRACINGLPFPNFLIGIWNFIFGGSPPIITSTFPYLQAPKPVLFDYGGTRYWKDLFSVATLCPILFALFGLWQALKTLFVRWNNKFLALMIGVLLICGVGLAGYIGATVGTYQRYMVDFAWMLILAALSVFYVLYEQMQGGSLQKILRIVLLGCTLVSLSFLPALFCGESFESGLSFFEYRNPVLFHQFVYFFSFWL